MKRTGTAIAIVALCLGALVPPWPAPSTIPPGTIVMWSGSLDELPLGWALCDGTNGTPDLRDRFIVGAGSVYGLGDTGGRAYIDLRHSHTLMAPGSDHIGGGAGFGEDTGDGLHQPVDIRPPYHAVYFIQKLNPMALERR